LFVHKIRFEEAVIPRLDIPIKLEQETNPSTSSG